MTNPIPTEPTYNPIRLGAAFRALWRLALDNDDTTQVFKIVDALRGRSDLRNVERMRESEIGRAILAERRSLLDVLANRERLRALPEGSLGRIYLAFMEREGLTADGLAAAADEGYQRRTSTPTCARSPTSRATATTSGTCSRVTAAIRSASCACSVCCTARSAPPAPRSSRCSVCSRCRSSIRARRRSAP
jgi:hypothetical protein